jgi:signal transduction histidine kinase
MPRRAAAAYRAGMGAVRWLERLRGRAALVDVLLVLAIGGFQVLVVIVGGWPSAPRWRGPDPLAVVLVATGTVALLFRRRWPLPVLAVTLAVALAYSARTYPEGPSGLPVYAALYTVVTLVERRRLVWLAVAATVVVAVGSEVFLYGDSQFDGEPVYVAISVVAFAWLAEAVRARRAYVAELRDRAERAERTREEEARRRVHEERMRIARELHDVVSHTIGVISVQAGVAAHLLRRRPDKAAESLAAIRQASDEALGELHAMLGVLRDADDRPPPLAPAPGLAELDALVAQAGRTGLEVRVSVEGEPRRLPPAVDLAAYRVVQESLTNVVRHARASRAEVTVTHRDGCVEVEVVDDGKGLESPSGRQVTDSDRQDRRSGRSGQGILGMRERARALGGTLEAGPRPGGGFLVRASLPLDAAAGERR